MIKLMMNFCAIRSIGAHNSKKSLCKFIAFYLVGILSKITGPALAYNPIFAGNPNFTIVKHIRDIC